MLINNKYNLHFEESRKYNKKNNKFKNNFKFYIIIFVLIFFLMFLQFFFVSNKNKCLNSNKPENCEIIINNEKLITLIPYEKYDTFIYNLILMKNSSNIFLNNNLTNDIINISDSTFNKILFYISDYEIINNTKKFESNLILLSKKNLSDLNEHFDGFNILNLTEQELWDKDDDRDIDEIDNNNDKDENYDTLNNDKPIIKFYFYENGKIDDILFPKFLRNDLKKELINFIYKIIFDLSKNSFINKDNKIIKKLIKNKNQPLIINNLENKKINLDYIQINSSEIKSNITIYLNENNYIKEIKTNYFFSIYNDNNEINESNIYNDFIKVSNSEKSNIKLELKYVNNSLKDLIKEHSKDIIFVSLNEINKENDNLNKFEKIEPNELEEYKDFEKNDSMRKLYIKSFDQKIIFKYSILKTKISNIDIGIISYISFYPQNGTIYTTIIYKNNNKQLRLIEEKAQSNYANLTTIINRITSEFTEKINNLSNQFSVIDWDEYKNNIFSNINTIYNNINLIYNIEDIFDLPLSELNNNIINITQNSYKNLIGDITKSRNEIENFNNSIEKEIQIIINETKQEYNNYLQLFQNYFKFFHQNNLNFLKNINDTLNINNEIESIFYFKIEDLLSNTENEYENVLNQLKNSINKKNNNTNKFINEYIYNKSENSLIILELIADNINNNIIYIQDEQLKKNVIYFLNNFRTQIELIDIKFRSILNDLYENLNIENNNEFMEYLKQVNKFKINFKEKKEQIINRLINKIEIGNNIAKYNKDFKILFNIRNKIRNTRINNFNIFFSVPLNESNDQFFNFDENIFKNLSNLRNDIISNIRKNNSINNYLDNYNSYLNKILKENYGDKLIKNYYDIYANSSFLNNNIDNYYVLLDPIVNEYITIFISKYFNAHVSYYLDNSNDLLNTLSEIKKEQNKNLYFTLSNLNQIIQSNIKNKINNAYNLLINYVTNDYYKILQNIDKSNLSLTNLINNKFNNYINTIKTKNTNDINIDYQYNMLHLNNNDPFSLSNKIKSKEDIYINLIQNFIDQINLKINKQLNNINEEQIVLNKYSNSKFYNSFFYFDFINESKYLISINDIQDLNSYNYIGLFNNTDFEIDLFINNLLNYINSKKEEDISIIKSYTQQLNDNYTNVFENNLNYKVLSLNIRNLAKYVFDMNIKLFEKTQDFVTKIYQNFMDLKNKYINSTFFLDNRLFHQSFKSLETNLINKLKNISNFLSNFKLDSELINEVILFYKEQFDNGYNKMIEIINNNEEIFYFFNLTYNIKEEGVIILNKIKNNYYNYIEKEVNKIYKEEFNILKTNIYDKLIKEKNKIIEKLNDYYEETYAELSYKSNTDVINDNNKILNKIDDNVVESILSYSSVFLNNLTKLNDISYRSYQNKKLKSYKINYDFDNFTQIINNFKITFNNISKDRLKNKKLEFLLNYNELIKTHFQKIITNFSEKEGINFIQTIYDKFYSTLVINKLEFFSNIIFNIKTNILNFILPNISKIDNLIKDFLLNFLNDIINNIENNINENIEKIFIEQINTLIKESSSKIILKYNNTLINTILDDKTKSIFSDLIYDLIPKELKYSLIKNLTKIFENIVINKDFGNLINLIRKNSKEYVTKFKNELNDLKNKISSQSETLPKSSYLNFQLINHINEYIKNIYKKYLNNIVFEDIDSKINNIKEIINDCLYEKLNIIEKNYYLMNKEKNKITLNEINKILNYSKTFQDKLNSSKLIESSKKALNNLNIIKSDLNKYILNSFSNFSNNVNITLNLNRRRLSEQVSIYSINEALKSYNQSFYEYTYKINEHKKIIEFEKIFENFKNIIINSCKNINKSIINTLNLLELYLTEENFIELKKNLNKQTDNIINQITLYQKTQSDLINKSLNLLKKDLPLIFLKNYNKIKNLIDNSVKELYNKTFPKVNKINIPNSFSIKNIKLIKFNSETGDTHYDYENGISNLNTNYNFDLNYIGNFEFKINFYIYFEANIKGNYNGDPHLQYDLEGDLTKGLIKVIISNDFPTEKVKIEYNYGQNQASYNTRYRKGYRKKKRKWWCLWLCYKNSWRYHPYVTKTIVFDNNQKTFIKEY